MDCKDGRGIMKYHNGDVFEGEFSKDKMHGKDTYSYAAGDLSKSVHYENDEVKSDSNVKREAPSDENTDTDVAPPRRSKRRNLNVDNIRENSLQVVLPELSNESPLDDGYEVLLDVTPIARKDEVSSETRRTSAALL
eukprot:scaffold13806_cov80-Skeletonema_dohrnii-CCMP3373.AAC.2